MPENEHDIEHRLTKLEDYKRIVIDKIQKLEEDTIALHKLATSVAVMATKMGAVENYSTPKKHFSLHLQN